jgi:FkbM family methyltransferase
MSKIEDYLNDHYDELTNWLVDNNWGGVDVKILPFLSHIDNGFFVEAGAHDGIFQSNTKILEELGWEGLLIEPSNNLYLKCKENRNCDCENYALVSSNYINKTIKASNSRRKNYDKNFIITMGDDKVDEFPTITLDNLLKKYKRNKIDFFSLDVEGYEFEVLNGIDFGKIDISYLLIEVNIDDYSLLEMDNFMKLKGYENICNLSNFTKENCNTWPGNHNDYLYKKT